MDGGTCLTAFSVATAMGSAAPSTTTSWMAHSLSPNHRIASGSQQMDGTELSPRTTRPDASASRSESARARIPSGTPIASATA